MNTLFIPNECYYLQVINKLASRANEIYQNEVLCLEVTYRAENMLRECQLFRLFLWDSCGEGEQHSSSDDRPQGHRKTSPISPCGFCVNRNTLEWQNFLNWKHTWEAPFKNSAAGPTFFSWGQKPALVLQGQAFRWAPEAQVSSPVPMKGLRSPSTPGGPGHGRENLERKAHSQQLALVRWGQWGFLRHTLQHVFPGPLQVMPDDFWATTH